MRILIVDDSAYQRFLIRSHLSVYGDCEEVHDGAQGVERFQQALDQGLPFTLVVMDILMPVMNGHEALKRIIALQDAAGIPAQSRARTLMLSSLVDPDTMLAAQFESGADMYLTKPADGPTLVEAFKNLCLAPEVEEDEEDEAVVAVCPSPGAGGGLAGGAPEGGASGPTGVS